MHRAILGLAVGFAGAFALASGALAQEPSTQAAVRSFQFTYGFTVNDVPAAAQNVVVWVPLPPSNEWQDVLSWTVEGAAPYTEVREPVYGNTFLRFDFSGMPVDERTASIDFEIARRERRPVDSPNSTATLPTNLRQRLLAPDSMVPLDGPIAEEAQATAGAAADPLAIGRALYYNLVSTVQYDKPDDGGQWGRGDALWACDARYGNCTDFHSLFIGQSRSLGVPARFKMGFTVPNEKEGPIAGYHCWAEFWVDGYGWIPVDASDANRYPERRDSLFGGLDSNRVEFTIGRDIELPGAAAGPVNFIIYPYAEVDGQKHTAIERSFAYRDAH